MSNFSNVTAQAGSIESIISCSSFVGFLSKGTAEIYKTRIQKLTIFTLNMSGIYKKVRENLSKY